MSRKREHGGMNARDRLRELLAERSVRLGDFTLASGARSSYYIDARRTTMSAEGQFLTGKVCRDALAASGLSVTHVGGLTMGADPVAYAIARESFVEGRPLDAFSVRKQAKLHGTGQRIEGGLPEGSRCLVIEDSMTSGGSALEAIAAVEAHGCTVAGVLTLVDREEGARARLESRGYPLIAVFTGPELLAAARARQGSNR
jgi:orotate phosphoribosyltransferase